MRWKWVLGIAALLMVTLVVTAYLILASYDYNKFKPRITQAVKDATGRELTLGGDIELAIGFSPSLVVADVTFANAVWGSQPQMMKAEKLQVQVHLLPLLFGDAELEGIALIGMDVLLETDATGKGNWEFPAGDKSTKSFWPVRELEVENVRVVKLNLTFHDGKTGSTTRFSLDSLDASRKPSSNELTIDLKGTANGQPLAVSGKIGLIRNLLAHKPLEVDLLAQVSGARITVAGVIGDVLKLDGIDLKVHASGTDLAGLARAAGAELPEVDTKLPKTGPFTVKGRLTGSGKTLSLQAAEGSVSRGSLRLAVNGKIKDLLALEGIDLKVKGSGKEVAEIGPLIGTKLPEFGSLDVTGNLSGSSKALALDGLSIIVGKSDFNGSAKVEFRQRPKITLVLESGLIDFTPLIGEEKKEEKEVSTKGGYDKPLFPDDPLPFKVLKKVDADIVLKAKNMKAREAQFDLGHLTLTLTDSELAIDTLEAVYKGTKLSGYVHIYPGSPPHVATKFLVQGFDLGGYLREIGASDKAEGLVDIAADLKSKGDSAHTLAANLDGTFGAVMGQGYLTKWLDLIATDLSKKVMPFWGKHKEAGNIICAVVEFDSKNGLATSQAFVFDTEIAILTAEGDINLETEQVNFLLSPKPKGLSLTTLNTKLRVRGSIKNPKVRPSMASLAFKGAKALSALVVGPVGLLAPFVSLGAHKKHPCDVQSIGKGDQSVPVKKGDANR
jgi:uncharacterized protein involved in outer membrane biogenesis